MSGPFWHYYGVEPFTHRVETGVCYERYRADALASIADERGLVRVALTPYEEDPTR